ncbi:MAG: hypothetical protein JW808_01895 [Victivallales bacterium]|nr:hypothetical protein [Victivallales bacterium]
MRKIASTARIVFTTTFRRGAGWGLLVFCVISAVFMFFATNSDSTLVNELQLRFRYSLYAFTTILNISLLYFGCVSLRKDIDERRFHTVSAAPVHRWQLFWGHFFGIFSLGVVVFLACSAALTVSCAIFIAGWPKPEEKAGLGEKFFSTYYLCYPDLSGIMDGIRAEYEKRVAQYNLALEEHEHDDEHHHHDDVWKGRKVLLDDIKKERQIISPGGTGSWQFEWNPASARGEFILLRFKLYANVQRSMAKGEWRITDDSGKTVWHSKFADYPFLAHELKIPLESVPKERQLKISFIEEGGNYIIFPVHHGGLLMLYNSGGLFKNFVLATVFSLSHMALLVALSLTYSSIFSFSVAVFVSMATFMTGLLSGFFAKILDDLTFFDPSFAKVVFSFFLKVGLWLTESAKAPPVCRMFSEGISVPVAKLLAEWGPGFAAYFGIVLAIGIISLNKKEIDKILQS